MENLEALIQSESPPPVLYTYETAQGLQQIILNRSFPVPDIRFVNDNIELAYLAELFAGESARILEAGAAAMAGKSTTDPEASAPPTLPEPSQDDIRFELLLDEIGERLASPPRYHLFARHLAREGDQWVGRQGQGAGSKSYSLGFDSRLLIQHGAPLGFRLVKCIFNEGRQQKIVQELLAETRRRLCTHALESPDFRLHLHNLADDFLMACIQLSALFKHPAHYQGDHWCLFCLPPFLEPGDTRLQFHVINDRLAPWLAIEFTCRPDHPFPLTRLIIAPDRQPDLAMDAVELLLSVKGLGHCQVEMSRMPYKPF